MGEATTRLLVSGSIALCGLLIAGNVSAQEKNTSSASDGPIEATPVYEPDAHEPVLEPHAGEFSTGLVGYDCDVEDLPIDIAEACADEDARGFGTSRDGTPFLDDGDDTEDDDLDERTPQEIADDTLRDARAQMENLPLNWSMAVGLGVSGLTVYNTGNAFGNSGFASIRVVPQLNIEGRIFQGLWLMANANGGLSQSESGLASFDPATPRLTTNFSESYDFSLGGGLGARYGMRLHPRFELSPFASMSLGMSRTSSERNVTDSAGLETGRTYGNRFSYDGALTAGLMAEVFLLRYLSLRLKADVLEGSASYSPVGAIESDTDNPVNAVSGQSIGGTILPRAGLYLRFVF